MHYSNIFIPTGQLNGLMFGPMKIIIPELIPGIIQLNHCLKFKLCYFDKIYR